MSEGRTGVLIMGFGGPDCLEAVGPFMCNLMGREPSEELVSRVQRRYLAIGGASPLPEIASALAGKLEDALAEAGHDVPVTVGMRYWDPFIEDGIAHLVASGCSRIILLSLSPFESKVASGAYRESVEAASAAHPDLEFVEAPLISELEEFVAFYAGSTAVELMDIEPNEGVVLAFSAHSLPESDLTEDDPYVAGLRATADRLALKLGLEEGHDGAGGLMFEQFRTFGSDAPPRAWYLVFQSKGQRPGAWLGPDLDELIEALADTPATGLIVVPIGFATDHMETLYDLDIVSAGNALDRDLVFARAQVPNDHDTLVIGLVRVLGEML